LESRLLLYAINGGEWQYGTRITFSFMPDGTSVGGTPSNLISMLNAKYPTSTWVQQFQLAAAVWEEVANINLVQQFPDDARPYGAPGYQQGDPGVGDIRIGAVPLQSGVLALCALPPPNNGGTVAGDFLLNSSMNWQIGGNYDLETVAIHEFGHALGLADSLVKQAEMYATYHGVDTTLATDDIAGIQAVWGARQPDIFNSNGNNNGVWTSSASITGYFGNNGIANQITLTNLDLTTPGQYEWFVINIPSWKNGTMAVQMQSSNLSELSPRLAVFQGNNALQAMSTSTGGSTVEVDYPVAAGQTYLIRASAAAGSPSDTGNFGLQVNIGLTPFSPISPPNTTVLAQGSVGGGYTTNAISASSSASSPITSRLSTSKPQMYQLGNLTVWGDTMTQSGVTLSSSASGVPIVLSPATNPHSGTCPNNTLTGTATNPSSTGSTTAMALLKPDATGAGLTATSYVPASSPSGSAPPNTVISSSTSTSSSSPSASVLQAVDRVLSTWNTALSFS
jgi:hypothetical protein